MPRGAAHSPTPVTARRSFARPALFTGGAVALAASLVALAAPASAAGYENSVGLGTADPYSVLAGSTVTNTNSPTVLSGSLGVSPGSAITGFPQGWPAGRRTLGMPRQHRHNRR